MQTFLPYASFADSVRVLDDKRLGKQRVECLQILRTLAGQSIGWRNHPAVLMWKGYEQALTRYAGWCIFEWKSRGFNSTIQIVVDETSGYIPAPPWLGDERLHSSHRANLLRKDPVHYGRFGWTEDPSMPYYWPVRRTTNET